MSETPTLVSFYEDWSPTGEVGDDGLPVYQRALWIVLSRPPYLEIRRPATDGDKHEYREPFELYEKQEKARKMEDGYPLSMWPVCNEADLKLLAFHDIYTVDQLAKLAGRNTNVPPSVKELAERAAVMQALQKGTGQYGEIIDRLERENTALKEQVQDANNTIAAQKAALDTLKSKGKAA